MKELPKNSRCVAKINIDNLKTNLNYIKSALPDHTAVLAVVKADAYGHNAKYVSRAIENDVEYFAVAEPREAIELRVNGIKKPILILGYSSPEYARELYEKNITQAIFSLDYARKLSDELKGIGQKLKVHIKLNTGMTRLGFDYFGPETVSEIKDVYALPELEIEGIFSHYAEADNFDSDYTEKQNSAFRSTVKAIEDEGYQFKYKHISNSAGCLFGDNSDCNLARAGIMLYGSYPSNQVRDKWSKLHPDKKFLPVMSLMARVAQIREVEKGVSVGYGRTYVAPEKRTIAILTAGYADGIPRLISNRAEAIEAGIKVVGRVCMDMFFVDITGFEKKVIEGQLVTIFGENSLSVENFAESAETISYEVFCGITKRVMRIISEKDELIYAD